MTTTPRERVWSAIRHVEPDRVPYHISFTAPARRKLEDHFGSPDLDEILDNHLVKYKPRAPDAWQEVRTDFWRDEFGVVWDRTVDKDIGVVERYPLRRRSLEGLTLPEARDPLRYEALPRFVAANPNRFRVINLGFSLFERAWTPRSMPELLIDMLEAPDFVDQLFDTLVEFNLAIIEHVLAYDIDGVMFGDDWGHQKGLLFGAPLWRRFIKPRLARMYAAVKRAGKVVLIHSCGRVQELFPELIELGLDVFNPFQPEVMDCREMKRQFGRDLCFYGGVSIQRLLPRGTPQEIRDEVRRLMDDVGRGGGFIVAPSHDMPGDIPLENMLAFTDAVREQ